MFYKIAHDPFFVLRKTSKLLKNNGLLFLTTKNIWFKNIIKKNSNLHSWFNPIEIANELKKNSIKIIKIFEQPSCKCYYLDESNTFFILGKKYIQMRYIIAEIGLNPYVLTYH